MGMGIEITQQPCYLLRSLCFASISRRK